MPVEMHCMKCGKNWLYKGIHKMRCACPDCGKIIKIEQENMTPNFKTFKESVPYASH